MQPPSLRIERIEKARWSEAFAIMRQLRSHLDLDEFLRRTEMQAASGYVLHGACGNNGQLLGLIGMRPVTTLARGAHLHVDDLVVDQRERGTGVGRALMAFAEDWAQRHALQTVFLDSRPEVLEFYGTIGYTPHTSALVRKTILAR